MDILMWQWKRKKILANSGGGVPSPWGSVTMRHSFHHPALTTCGAPLPNGKKYVAVRYLTKEIIFFVIDVKGKGQEIFEDACKYLGLQDTELFGLALIHDEEYIFIDPILKVSKYAVKNWKTTDNGIGGDGQPLLVFYLRVKHYVDCHLLISEKVARHHYYLQLLDNVRLFSQPVSEEKFFVLAALALQADLGNYCKQRHQKRYFDINSYFPTWFLSKIGEDFIIRNVPALHNDNVGLSRGEAQVGYIKEASDITSPHNLHLYKMQRRKGKSWNGVWLGISDSGLHIYEQQGLEKTKTLLSTFLWCNIAKLHFEKKKFEILSEGSPEYRRFTYYVGSDEMAKNLLNMCRSTHHFHMSNEIRVQDLKKLELDGGKSYRESYIYTDETDLAEHKKQNQSPVKNILYNGPVMNGNARHENTVFVPNQRHGRPRNIHRLHSDAGNRRTPSHINRSMEALPHCNGYSLSPDVKYKSQSIACFSDQQLTPHQIAQNQAWTPSNNCNLSTLRSQSSCTDSACSSLSLASSSTVKASASNGNSRRCYTDSNQWVKCNSFEELSVDGIEAKSLPHKVCISTFKDNHVRTASFYDAVGLTSASDHPQPTVPSRNNHTGYKSSASKAAQVRNQQNGRRHSNDVVATCRTATRIGVSSLNREQRLPLTLFKGKMTACGSEPNLYNSPFDCDGGKLTDFAMLRDSVQSKMNYVRKTNSRSEMCLSVIGQSEVPLANQCNFQLMNCKRFDLPSAVESSKDGIEEVNEEFPFIPPPLAYRNSSEEINSTPTKASTVAENSPESEEFSPHRELHSSLSSPPDVLDIQQLRQKSQDLDLPLISGLCNDRSLLMLPKTVPCSRQRHLGNNDPLRFARGYSTAPSSAHISDFGTGHYGGGRPATWHESSSSSPWFSGYMRQDSDNGQNLPPTILTSFGRTPDKCNMMTPESPYQSSDYRLHKQMIPTKLMSGFAANGKIHLKGSSS